MKRVAPGIGGSDRTKSSCVPNDFTAADQLERKAENQLKTFYDAVIAGLADVDVLLIRCPGEAQDESLKRIKIQTRNTVTLKLEAPDKMTVR